MAVVRGRLEKSAVILVSATPSIETRVNAAQGRYGHLRLAARFKAVALPELAAIDLRAEAAPRGKWISPRLEAAISGALARRTGFLFLNRRGYAPLTLCRACGHRFKCPNCTAWLVEHRFRRALICHHCGHVERRPTPVRNVKRSIRLPPAAPASSDWRKKPRNFFRGRIFSPSPRIFRAGRSGCARIEEISRGECDIVIGTQLVAKGHNFPHLSLVGVIDADIGLTRATRARPSVPLTAAAGDRARRQICARPGRRLVQTWQPGHPVIRALISGDCERFYEEETRQRRLAGLPPSVGSRR